MPHSPVSRALEPQHQASDPKPPSLDLNAAIEPKPSGGRASSGRNSLYGESVEVKQKMLAPIVGTRVEERQKLTRFRVARTLRSSLPQVARVAREREIVEVIGAATGLWDHVVHVEFLVEHLLGSATVLATMSGARGNSLIQPMGHSPSG
jgi:hypothetical protein